MSKKFGYSEYCFNKFMPEQDKRPDGHSEKTGFSIVLLKHLWTL